MNEVTAKKAAAIRNGIVQAGTNAHILLTQGGDVAYCPYNHDNESAGFCGSHCALFEIYEATPRKPMMLPWGPEKLEPCESDRAKFRVNQRCTNASPLFILPEDIQ